MVDAVVVMEVEHLYQLLHSNRRNKICKTAWKLNISTNSCIAIGETNCNNSMEVVTMEVVIMEVVIMEVVSMEVVSMEVVIMEVVSMEVVILLYSLK